MVKTLLKSVREYKKATILTPFFVALEVVMEVLLPFVMALLIDQGIEKGNMNVIYKYGFILRYPKVKENITGFKYEPWHYRYVGKEVAKIIYEKNIVLEEY